MTDIFVQASRIKLRFQSSKGLLNVEDLWDLSTTALNNLGKVLNKAVKDLKEVDDFDMLSTTKESKELELAVLRFEVVKYILTIKLEEANTAKTMADKKAQKEKLAELIERKRDNALAELSVEDLEKMLATL